MLPFNAVVRKSRRDVVWILRVRWIRVSGALGIGNESSIGFTDGCAIAVLSVAILIFVMKDVVE